MLSNFIRFIFVILVGYVSPIYLVESLFEKSLYPDVLIIAPQIAMLVINMRHFSRIASGDVSYGISTEILSGVILGIIYYTSCHIAYNQFDNGSVIFLLSITYILLRPASVGVIKLIFSFLRGLFRSDIYKQMSSHFLTEGMGSESELRIKFEVDDDKFDKTIDELVKDGLIVFAFESSNGDGKVYQSTLTKVTSTEEISMD